MYKVIQGFLKLYTIMQQNFCYLESKKYLYLGRTVCLSFAAHGCITIKSEILSLISPDIDIQEPKTKKAWIIDTFTRNFSFRFYKILPKSNKLLFFLLVLCVKKKPETYTAQNYPKYHVWGAFT